MLIKKRTIIKLFSIGGVITIISIMFGYPKLKYLFRKAKGKFKTSSPIPTNEKRVFTSLPQGGETVSVEMALNSRCCSDYDDDPYLFHWGMFNRKEKLSDSNLQKVIDLIHTPNLANHGTSTKLEGNIVSFIINNKIIGVKRDWVMMESGMQQQRVSLVCAALGIGILFRNQGKDGKLLSDNKLTTIKMKLDPMKPAYNGTFWTKDEPHTESAWVNGNLPDPIRDGTMPLVSALKKAAAKNLDGRQTNKADIGQILWAARGRTPHMYKSIPWGMTIPTWGGKQNISKIYFLTPKTLYEYKNVNNGRPTHVLDIVGQVNQDSWENILSALPSWKSYILFSVSEQFSRTFWEVGYQLMNILVQCTALKVAYEMALLDEDQRQQFSRLQVVNPVAAIALKTGSSIDFL
jgi:hypothetical protein